MLLDVLFYKEQLPIVPQASYQSEMRDGSYKASRILRFARKVWTESCSGSKMEFYSLSQTLVNESKGSNNY